MKGSKFVSAAAGFLEIAARRADLAPGGIEGDLLGALNTLRSLSRTFDRSEDVFELVQTVSESASLLAEGDPSGAKRLALDAQKTLNRLVTELKRGTSGLDLGLSRLDEACAGFRRAGSRLASACAGLGRVAATPSDIWLASLEKTLLSAEDSLRKISADGACGRYLKRALEYLERANLRLSGPGTNLDGVLDLVEDAREDLGNALNLIDNEGERDLRACLDLLADARFELRRNRRK